MRTITNIDGIVKTFNNDSDFLNYARLIYQENEDGQHWIPENIQQATEYIKEYCPYLELNEVN